MDIKVGEYIRTKSGKIDIFKEKDENYMFARCQKNTYWIFDITKYSKNIIDLIEVGDIVNNGYIYEVGKTKDGHKWVHSLNGLLLFENDIKTILTHEQMEENQYVVKRNMETN